MSDVGTRDARIREQLGAWWAEEFPAMVMPTEALIRLSERLAALSPVSRIRATGSIDDGRDWRLPDRRTVTDAFGVPFMQISTPAPSPSAEESVRRGIEQAERGELHDLGSFAQYAESPSAEEEARRLAPCQCGVGVWLGAGRDPRAHASLCPVRLRDAIATALTKRSGHKACPCLHTTPCDPRCTCVQPYSSRGCSRCCSYGNPEQQQAQAEALAKRDAEVGEG